MPELNIIIDNFGHKELKEYLMSLNGIFDVKITNVRPKLTREDIALIRWF